MKRLSVNFFFSFMIIFLSASLYANTIVVSDALQSRNITPSLELFEDREGSLTVEKIIQQRSNRSLWKNPPPHSLDLGFSKSVYWLYLEVENRSNSIRDWFIDFQWTTIDTIELYSPDGKRLQRSGDMVPYPLWSVHNFFPSFKISIGKGVKKEFYIRLQSGSIMSFPIYIQSAQYQERFERRMVALTFLFLGIILLFIIHTIINFVHLRDPIYLLFGLKVLFISLIIFIGYGNAYSYLWPESPVWQNRSQVFFVSLVIIPGILIYRKILNIKEVSGLLDRITHVIIAGGAVLAVLSLFPVAQHIKTFLASGFLIFGILIYVAGFILTIPDISRKALYLLIGWALFLVSLFFNVMYHIGVIQYSHLAVYGFVIMLPVELFFFKLSLSERTREMQRVIQSYKKINSELIMKLEAITNSPRPQYTRSYISGLDTDEVLSELRRFMDIEQLYLDDTLSPAILCERLNITSYQLSELLNKVLNTNFTRLINEYRVIESQKIMDNHPSRTILQVAHESGFASKPTFNREFKRITGKTPMEYQKNRLMCPHESTELSAMYNNTSKN
ncbi:MAG TPA: 7TM-DISM domain-containing protein [Spirochaetota bacterium]|nr:7TM-DISM domain-containing protein [Spirochaetota bacterium]HPQ53885.1 7TM-DISM domain-containing protein [Spirochaetota bacterium]